MAIHKLYKRWLFFLCLSLFQMQKQLFSQIDHEVNIRREEESHDAAQRLLVFLQVYIAFINAFVVPFRIGL